VSLFLRVVFSRKAAARAVRISEFVFLPSGFISVVVTAPIGSLKLTSISVAQLQRWQRMVLSEARGLRLFSVVQGGIGLHRRLGARRHIKPDNVTGYSPSNPSVIERRMNCVKGSGLVRFAFYLHFYDANLPLQWSYGQTHCPPVEPVSRRLKYLVPYRACN
jgi:hypothetical protein